MHELAIAMEIIRIAADAAQRARVARVAIRIGKLSCVSPDALRFSFDLAAEGTAVAGAALDIERTDGAGRCRACGASVAMESVAAVCGACGGLDLAWTSGEELVVSEVELVEAAAPIEKGAHHVPDLRLRR